jgi:hypothetical protein
MEAVDEFDAEAAVVVGERANAEAPFLAGMTDHVPGHKALGTRDLVRCDPKEGTASTVEGGQNTRGSSSAAMAKAGSASRMALRSMGRPPKERRSARQPVRYLSTLAMRGANAVRRSFSAESGSPR